VGRARAAGDVDGDGYAVCPLCDKDFWVTAVVRGDVLTAIEVNPAREPYVP